MLLSPYPGLALPVRADETGTTDAAALLRDGLWTCADSIDLSACRLPRGEMGCVFAAVVLDSPALFHVDGRMSFTYDRAGLVLSVFPTYTLTGDKLGEARALYADTVGTFLSDLAHAALPALRLMPAHGETPALPWCEADTVIFLHEWLAVRYGYDEGGTRFDALSLFRDGIGVCQAYALAFLALARAAGLEAEVAVSAEMDHAWNRVRADGAWYHVDVTRDDRAPAGGTAVYHDRLLMSDAAARARGYAGYDTPLGHACLSDRYECPEGGVLSALPPTALRRVGDGWLTEGDGLPCRVDPAHGLVGLPGDIDGDETVTIFDLLLLDADGMNADGVRAVLLMGGEG